ncbi:helix-turn-helix domain-containing protein [Edaphocola aurantiacus]|uniref:helix-turn-helix domain-containing protein n=1 Tax=Edaphocola aurantiacus TaxID=2601682 RepID=UPI001C970A5C|nr:helix-turn-helix domain-containing protein [Edaphocola aurantiacus]
MFIYVKYMVSQRCKLKVIEELEQLSIRYRSVELGSIEMDNPLSESTLQTLGANLKKSGLEILDDKRSILIERIKNTIVEMIYKENIDPLQVNYSVYIASELHYDYTYLANIFSEVTGITIQHFIILHKIERVKELLLYDELTLTEISYLLNYSSVAHLSYQFKKVTGLTPTFFKRIRKMRISQ